MPSRPLFRQMLYNPTEGTITYKANQVHGDDKYFTDQLGTVIKSTIMNHRVTSVVKQKDGGYELEVTPV